MLWRDELAIFCLIHGVCWQSLNKNTCLSLNICFNQITCKPCLQLLTLVGNDIVIWWYKGAAWAVQTDLQSTVSICGEAKIKMTNWYKIKSLKNYYAIVVKEGGICLHLCGSAIHSLPQSHQRTATLPLSEFVQPCCQYIAASGMSSLCILKSVEKRMNVMSPIQQIF